VVAALVDEAERDAEAQQDIRGTRREPELGDDL